MEIQAPIILNEEEVVLLALHDLNLSGADDVGMIAILVEKCMIASGHEEIKFKRNDTSAT